MGKSKSGKSHKKLKKQTVEAESVPKTVIDESDDDVESVGTQHDDTSSQQEEKKTSTVEAFESVAERFSSNLKKVKQLISDLSRDYQLLEKSHKREVKDARKNRRNKGSKKRDVKSGFNKPTPVPDDVAKMFDIEPGTLLARTVITKMIYQYIKDNGLQNVEDKREIYPDSKIRKLFQLSKTDQLTFKNFQTHMKKLYPKKKTTVESNN